MSSLAEEKQDNSGNWVSGIMPKSDTQAAAFLQRFKSYDGRNTIVGILDTGVDPGAEGLQVTSDGKKKVIDLVDATGSGDVSMGEKIVLRDEEDTVVGLTGRTLTLNRKDWTIRDNTIRLGMKAGYDIFPRGLKRRLQRERKKKWQESQNELINEAQMKVNEFEKILEANSGNKKTDEETQNEKNILEDLKLRVEQLRALSSSTWEDLGPVYDCIVFHDGKNFRAVVDVDESGDLSRLPCLTDYSKEYQFSTFTSNDACLNFAVNIYDEGRVLSIVNDAGAHGTHVAGIVSANYPNAPETNGIAPGAQIVGIRIGDTRLGSMETSQGLIRGIIAVLKSKCDIVNMSYGEPSKSPNFGRFSDFANELVNKHNVMYIASAGNAGPALSSVGAPGGTTSSIISVGAYVSPHMMLAEYNMRKTTPPINYTWSSRGPAFDGDYGVSISAPGGAITCVPNWTLQKNQLMNGTSMSSPNAAGNVALLLSALKQQNISYSPPRIRRAIENTAADIATSATKLDSGHGLLQVATAYDYLIAQKDFYEQDINFNISPRGLYLRQPHQVLQPYVTSFRVTPQFHEREDKRRLIEFEMRISLSCTQEWVTLASNMVLMHGGRGFEVSVDPTKLHPGVHFAEILGTQGTNAAAGPIFRIPITVCIPEKLDATSGTVTGSGPLGEIRLSPGSIERRFVAVPDGAQWVDIVFNGGTFYGSDVDSANSRIYMLHMQHVVKEFAHRDVSFKKSFRMVASERLGYTTKVYPGHTLEVCIAQYWSSLGDSSLNVDIQFRGVSPSEKTITFSNGENIVRVDLKSYLGQAAVCPTGKLSKWHESIRPTAKGVINAGSIDRDLMPAGRLIYNLNLNYTFNQEKSGKVIIRAPPLNNLLYEAGFGSQLYTIYDSNNRLIGTGDAFEETITCPKGKMTVKFLLRHDDRSKLEPYQNMILCIERDLEKNINLKFFKSQSGATTGEQSYGLQKLRKGAVSPVFVTLPSNFKVPKGAKPGDTLIGEIKYLDKGNAKAFVGEGTHPSGYIVKAVVPKAVATEKNNVKKDDAGTESLQVKLALWHLNEMKGGIGGKEEKFEITCESAKAAIDLIDGEKDVNEKELSYATYLSYLLKHKANDYVKNRFLMPQDFDHQAKCMSIIEKANSLINTIDLNKIKLAIAVKVADDDKEGEKEFKHRTAMKRLVVEALHLKAHALISKGDVQNEDLKNTIAAFQRWADGSNEKYQMLSYRRALLNEHYGNAMKRLLSLMGGDKDNGGPYPKKVLLWKELIRLFKILGWTAWHDYALLLLPAKYPTFSKM
eukprot:g9305.t1